MNYRKPMAISVATISVSIVEDDVEARKVFSRWVSRAAGFRLVGDWGDAESAVKSLPVSKPDVVLMDINLPGMSGVEAVKRLKPALPKTQFVMLTVYEDANHIYNALAAGATGYLLKQTSREELLTSLQDAHLGGSPITSNIARKVVQFFRQNPAPAAADGGLSPREQEVLELVTQGYRYKEIADKLDISVPTVNTYIRRIYEKLHVRTRTEAVARYAHLPVRGEANARRP